MCAGTVFFQSSRPCSSCAAASWSCCSLSTAQQCQHPHTLQIDVVVASMVVLLSCCCSLRCGSLSFVRVLVVRVCSCCRALKMPASCTRLGTAC
jgi:hypothetical protein